MIQTRQSPPWPRRGGCATNKISRSLRSRRRRGGWFNDRSSVAESTTPSAPSKEASRHFHYCRVHPSLAKEGSGLVQTLGNRPGQGAVDATSIEAAKPPL